MDGYRDVCARALERFGQDGNSYTSNTVAWICVLAPDAVAEFRQPLQLAEKAVASNPTGSDKYAYLNTLGGALYRAGQSEAAVQRLGEAITAHGKDGTAGDWLFLAMAHHRLGQADEARRWLDKAAKSIDESIPPPPPNAAAGSPPKPQVADTTLSWRERLELQLLRREAEELIKSSDTQP